MGLFVRLADWQTDFKAIRKIRQKVFIDEQHVSPEEEWDEHEETAQHFLAFHNDKAVGTGRITGEGKIGRMAVLKKARGLGAGQELLRFICKFARAEGQKSVYLNAQRHAIPFYEKAGFSPEGEPFMEAGIAHIRMVRNLTEKIDDLTPVHDSTR